MYHFNHESASPYTCIVSLVFQATVWSPFRLQWERIEHIGYDQGVRGGGGEPSDASKVFEILKSTTKT